MDRRCRELSSALEATSLTWDEFYKMCDYRKIDIFILSFLELLCSKRSFVVDDYHFLWLFPPFFLEEKLSANTRRHLCEHKGLMSLNRCFPWAPLKTSKAVYASPWLPWELFGVVLWLPAVLFDLMHSKGDHYWTTKEDEEEKVKSTTTL